jgi:hypothetical protein
MEGYTAMFRLIITVITGFMLVTAVSAYDANRRGMTVAFPHQVHQQSLGGCTDCHGQSEPGRIEELGEQWGHKTCVGCHRENQAGPVDCISCHGDMTS